MHEVISDTIIDLLKLLPFLFIAFLIIEIIEHKLSKKTEAFLIKQKKLGPLYGSILGAIPQCGFSVIATNLYITRTLSLGALISIYLSTSDEMIPILISNHASLNIILKIVVIKVVIGMICGFIIDLVYRKKESKHYDICETDHCDCEESIIKSSILHTLKTALFILIITFILNLLFAYIGKNMINQIFTSNHVLAPVLASFIGLIPNCGASIMITELYLNGIITLGTTIAGLLTGAGISTLILFRTNKNKLENLSIIMLIYFIGVFFGTLFNILGL